MTIKRGAINEIAGADTEFGINMPAGAVILDKSANLMYEITESAGSSSTLNTLTKDTIGGDGGGAVDSVNGKTGVVVLGAGDIPIDNSANTLTGANTEEDVDQLDTKAVQNALDIDLIQEEVANLAAASGQFSNPGPVAIPIPTVETDLPFQVDVPSSDITVLDYNDTTNTLTYKKDIHYNNLASFTFEANTNSQVTVTFRSRRVSDNLLIETRTIILEMPNNDFNTVQDNFLLTPGLNGTPASELEIKLTMQASITGMNLVKFHSQTIANGSDAVTPIDEFDELLDTPNTKVGQANKSTVVNGAGTDLVYTSDLINHTVNGVNLTDAGADENFLSENGTYTNIPLFTGELGASFYDFNYVGWGTIQDGRYSIETLGINLINAPFTPNAGTTYTLICLVANNNIGGQNAVRITVTSDADWINQNRVWTRSGPTFTTAITIGWDETAMTTVENIFTKKQTFAFGDTEFGDSTGNVEISFNPLASTGLTNIFMNGIGGTGRVTWNEAQTLLGLSATGAIPTFKVEATKNTSTTELDMSTKKVINVATPTVGTDVANKDYVDTGLGLKANKDGETITNASVNGVTLNSGGVATNFLNEQGNYVTVGGGVSEVFDIYMSANYTLTSTATILPFNTALINENSNFNTGTFKFVAPSDGNYFFNFSLQVTGATSDSANLSYIFKNGAEYSRYFINTSVSYGRTDWARFIILTAGDTIEIRSKDSSGTINGTATYSRFSGYKLN